MYGATYVLTTTLTHQVYGATYSRMEERNRRFYSRSPADAEIVQEIVARLHEAPQ